ncbi:MAG: ComF family protein [Bacteroidales bacterium]|nr:ComF family protein [Bacteroidales bacterium]
MKIFSVIRQSFKDLTDVAYPDFCLGCGKSLTDHEHSLCLTCQFQLAETGMHKHETNEITELFYNKTPIIYGCAFFKYIKGGLLQRLIHDLKYRGHPEIGTILGTIAAQAIKQSETFKKIDYIIPVPLHPRKLKKRGYNQSEKIAEGLSQVLNIPIDTNVLIKTTYNETQTKKHRFERFLNSQNLFTANRSPKYEGKHYLIVDDVLTTGSTLESCINELKTIPEIKVSIFTLGRAIQ